MSDDSAALCDIRHSAFLRSKLATPRYGMSSGDLAGDLLLMLHNVAVATD
ncbi:hypothetical protein MPC4_210027 [Methylocella tundrae]|uniref:Uncharacterized protein n=1 Tax=Methylocella tundrae TaxID=227605 RepID=A0A4U8Z4G7_METTU|nr:protein of unknown function [Methylocella tundrae]VTZ50220.1 hypothetical protein MPC4_210027 [Methylocella tundrae]